MNKRRIVSLLIMTILAVISVAGLVFAFNNSNKNPDIYANLTTSVSTDHVMLDIEVEQNEETKNLYVKNSNQSVGYFTITVGGLPKSANRGVSFDRVDNGILKLDLVEFNQDKGTSTFRVQGLNGGETTLVFTTNSGERKVYVTVSVNLAAKHVGLAKDAHFGVVKGQNFDLKSSNAFAKLVFYAHQNDLNRYYKPTSGQELITYQLKDNYQGVSLDQYGVLSVDETATANSEIYVLAKVPAMKTPLEVPVYIFEPMGNVQLTNTTAFVSDQVGSDVYDLILNRDNKDSATFNFSLADYGIVGEDYDFLVRSKDPSMVSVENAAESGCRTLFASRNLGETVIYITAYPKAVMTINGETDQEVWFNDASDANVQVVKEIQVRVRNEFIDDDESILKGQMYFDKDQDGISAFYYEGLGNPYADSFTINIYNDLAINYDNLIEFELDVTDSNGNFSGIYDKNGSPLKNVTLRNILDIRVLDENPDGDSLWEMDGRAPYNSRFSVALMKNDYAGALVGSNIQMKLRAKSVAKLSTSAEGTPLYATCEINLQATKAIDALEVCNADNEVVEQAILVYNKNLTDLNQAVTLSLRGIIADDGVSNGPVVANEWNVDRIKLSSNHAKLGMEDLPFAVAVDGKNYTFTVKPNANFEYYADYPIVFTYPNNRSKQINLKIYPYATNIAMDVVSNNDGIIYRSLKDYQHEEYLRTVYVRIGADYELNIETPGVSVGAGANLQFRADKEGLYANIPVHITADNEDVFAGRELDFLLNIVVVNPVRNIVLSHDDVELFGIGEKKNINITTTLIKDVADRTAVSGITTNIYQTLSDPNVSVSNLSIAGFTLTANYLIDTPVTLGFAINKRYDFGVDLNGDGDVDGDDVYTTQYIAGMPVKMAVSVKNINPVSDLQLLNENVVKSEKGVGNYLAIRTDTNESTRIQVRTVPSNPANGQVALAFARWQDGKFKFDFKTTIEEVLTAILADNGDIIITPVSNISSMGKYAMMVYALDSIKLVNGVPMPTKYVEYPFYLGTSEEIQSTITSLASTIHDANSGLRNDQGGYNWIVPSVETDTHKAILFVTTNGHDYTSNIKANRYYLDDLQTVLGWRGLSFDYSLLSYDYLSLSKYINGTRDSTLKVGGYDREALSRRYIDVDDVCQPGREVKYVLSYSGTANQDIMEFYPVECIDRFEVFISGRTGLVAGKNLGDSADVEFTAAAKMQRGVYFEFETNTNTTLTRWLSTNHDMSATNNLSYTGGMYDFVPYIVLENTHFEVAALKTTVKIETYGGVDYMNIAQVSTTMGGAAGATYDLTVKIDRPWNASLLNYWFVYESVSYPLFRDAIGENLSTFVPMAGGNAGFLWKLVCLNPKAAKDSNTNYYTYYLRLDVAIIIQTTTVDPFRNVYSAQIIVSENLENTNLAKEPVQSSAYLSVETQGITNVTFKHFANTKVDSETGDLYVPMNQTDTNSIFIDNNAVGGILRVFPTPYYISVDDIKLTSSDYYLPVVVGKDLKGNNIMDQTKYTIGFTQLVYNEDTKTYQSFLSGSSYKMVSSWSFQNGYRWDGVYYFKTYLVYSGLVNARLDEGTQFNIGVQIKSNGQTIRENMTLYARYKNGIVVTPDDDYDGEPAAVGTMVKNCYQALGTTAVYDVSFPANYVPNYLAYTMEGEGKGFVTEINMDDKTETLSVTLSGNTYGINKPIEIRIPYRLQGDFVNPYLSIIINPVYFEFNGLTFFNHAEDPVQVTQATDVKKLLLNVVPHYDTTIPMNIEGKLANFNDQLNNGGLVHRYYNDTYNDMCEVTIDVSYDYVDGVPVVVENGEFRFEQTINTIVKNPTGNLMRTEYQAIGLTKEYDLAIPNKRALKKNLETSGADADSWEAWLTDDGKIDVRLNYDTSLIGKILIIKVYSIYSGIPQFTLQIEPTYFTYNGFKLKNYPASPIVALSTPFVVTLEANEVEYFAGTGAAAVAVNNAIRDFNQELAASDSINFTRLEGTKSNFEFDYLTHELKRSGNIGAINYLKVSANVKYVNGRPKLVHNGEIVTTIFAVKTYGIAVQPGEVETPVIPLAPTIKTLRYAQAIGRTRTYDLAKANTILDSTLVMSERYGDSALDVAAWDATDSQWRATLKNNILTVTLDAETDLFGKTLIIEVYSSTGSQVYKVEIIPALYTIENFVIEDHNERPLWITIPGTVQDLTLDFEVDHADLAGYDFDDLVNALKTEINHSPLVQRPTRNQILTIAVGFKFANGEPHVVSVADTEAVVVQSNFAYEMHKEALLLSERTEAQVIGSTVTRRLSLSGGKQIDYVKMWQGNANSETLVEITDPSAADWSAITDNNKIVTIELKPTANLINKKLKVEIFANGELAFTYHIVPAYFVLDQFAAADQSGNELIIVSDNSVDYVMRNLNFVGVISARANESFGVEAKINAFNAKLNNPTYSRQFIRAYNSEQTSGTLTLSAYIAYVDGVPEIMDTATDLQVITRFNYSIYAAAQNPSPYPSLPDEPKSRTEIQAIGTKKSYKVDLLNQVLILNENNLITNENYTIEFVDNEIIVDLKPNLSMLQASNPEISIPVYSAFDTDTEVFVLTIRPVLFKVVGFDIINHPERPVRLISANEGIENLNYRLVAEYSDDVNLKNKISYNLDLLNENLLALLNLTDERFIQYETVNNRYLTIRAAISYARPDDPSFIFIAENEMSVVETTLAYQFDGSIVNTANYAHAIGTSARYYVPNINPTDYEAVLSNSSAGSATINGEYVILTLNADASLVTQNLTLKLVRRGDTSAYFTLNIKPVWFVIEGLEVNNHPERLLWLIANEYSVESIADLTYGVRAKHTYDAECLPLVLAKMAVFNNQLRTTWNNSKYIDYEVSNGRYLLVNIGVSYANNGQPELLNINTAPLNSIIKNIYEYTIYYDSGNLILGDTTERPSEPKSLQVVQAIGTTKEYHLDIPNVSLRSTKIGLVEITKSGTENEWMSFARNGWEVEVINDKTIAVRMSPNDQLLITERGKLIKLYIYSSYAGESPVFVFTIDPVWFVVTDIKMVDHPEDVISLSFFSDYETTIENFSNNVSYQAVAEYNHENSEAVAKFNNFNSNFNALLQQNSQTKYSKLTESKYLFSVATYVTYQQFTGVAEISADAASYMANRITRSFSVEITKTTMPSPYMEKYQAIGTTKVYGVNRSVAFTNQSFSGTGWSAELNNNQLTVNLSANSDLIDQGFIAIAVSDNFTLYIRPVWFEVQGFEIVEHAERPVWIYTPSSTKQLTYCVRTNKIPNGLDVQDKIDEFNTALNSNRSTLVSESIAYQKYIILRAGVEYQNGEPQIVALDDDFSNLVEEVFAYRVWADNQEPIPTHPSIMGYTAVNQPIGTKKSYSINNIEGNIYYQYLWLEINGKILTPSNSSASTITFQYATITYNLQRNKVAVQLAANADICTANIKVYIPYLLTENNQSAWYSYCIEIKPLLFEVVSWGITGDIQQDGSCIHLSGYEDDEYAIRFVANINRAAANSISTELNSLLLQEEELLNDYINENLNDLKITIKNSNIKNFKLFNSADGLKLVQLSTESAENSLTIAANINYGLYGTANVVNKGGQKISTEFYIYTGVKPNPWPPRAATGDSQNYIQAIGTTAKYGINITDMDNVQEICYDEIWTNVSNNTSINSLIIIKCDKKKDTISVEMKPSINLIYYEIQIGIPYVSKLDNKKYNYMVNIQPVLFEVDGLKLKKPYTKYNEKGEIVETKDNYIELGMNEVKLDFELVISHAASTSLKALINVTKENLENQINTMLVDYGENAFDIVLPDGYVDANARLVNRGGELWLIKDSNLDMISKLARDIYFDYANGIPTLVDEGDNDKISVEVSIVTKVEASPESDSLTLDDNAPITYVQAIGTTKPYQIDIKEDPNKKFYLEEFDYDKCIKNAGYRIGDESMDKINLHFEYEKDSKGRQKDRTVATFKVTLQANARYSKNPIEIYLPYHDFSDGTERKLYTVVKIKPVLFEVKSWKARIDSTASMRDKNMTDRIELNDAMVELYFMADIKSAPIERNILTNEDYQYINSAIAALENKINEYDPNIADKYEYLIINNTPEAGYDVNYTLYRNESTNTTYLMRDVNIACVTIMGIDANISYEVTDFHDTDNTNNNESGEISDNDRNEVVDAPDLVIGYDAINQGTRVNGMISIVTTDISQNTQEANVINQGNAVVLANLRENTEYILMSDIYLSYVTPNGWVPAAFPQNTVLDGNNFKIYLDGQGFDLSNNPSEIGLFSTVASGAVIKNVQIVIPQSALSSDSSELEIDLSEYKSGSVNIGLLAAVNNGVISNCAVTSDWQFVVNTWNEYKPTTIVNGIGEPFHRNLPMTADQKYVYDDDYFYEIDLDRSNLGGGIVKLKTDYIFDNAGVKLVKDENGKYTKKVYSDIYNNAWFKPNRVNVAAYSDISTVQRNGNAAARLKVTNSNKDLNIVLGGLVGKQNHVLTNSRVLIDVELDGPEVTTSSGENVTEVSAASAIVGGVIGVNSGTTTTSYFRDGNVINNAYVGPMSSNPTCYLGGFVGHNQSNGIISGCYAMGKSTGLDATKNYTTMVGSVKTIRNTLGGFAHLNAGTIKDCMVTMHIEKAGEGSAGGFVFKNQTGGTITNCIENNTVQPLGSSSVGSTDGGTLDYYRVFLVLNDNMINANSDISLKGLSNLKYAGAQEFSHKLEEVLTRLNGADFLKMANYEGFSIGKGNGGVEEDGTEYISDRNTIWKMTDQGPRLRAADDIAISCKLSQWRISSYAFNPGTERNPYLIWNAEQFKKYVYDVSPEATSADENGTQQLVESNRTGMHLRLVDNITLTTIPDTYKITYTGTFDGNGLTMNGIGLPSVAGSNPAVGLFGKLEYATIRNINFGISSIGINADGMRYVGGIAGIAINTNFVDVSISGGNVIGANIVGGIAGLTVITAEYVENYNITSAVSVTARRNSGISDPGSALFSSGIEYYRQALYALNPVTNLEQGYATAGGIFGFVTASPNGYIDDNYSFKKRYYGAETNTNANADMFMKDRDGRRLNDSSYLSTKIVLRKIGGEVKNVTANVAGGLIGITDTMVTIKDVKMDKIPNLTGKYYLGGVVGINLGTIQDGYVKASKFIAKSTVNNNGDCNYIYRASEAPTNPGRFWGMTIGGVAAYNNGTIKNLDVDVNMLNGDSKYVYVIGGVVGTNGNNGLVENTINIQHNDSRPWQTNSQASNVGYYFGNIIGLGETNFDLSTGEIKFINWDQSKMNLVRIPTTGTSAQHLVSVANFATPGYMIGGNEINAFGVDDQTHKVQILTIDEYKTYLASTSNDSIVDRVKALEIWYRTLPVTYPTRAFGSGSASAYLTEKVINSSVITDWITANDYFNVDSYNSNLDKTTIMNNYLSYINYAAITTGVTTDTDYWFDSNHKIIESKVAASREARYQMAIEFFTYTTENTSNPRNKNLTWQEYLNYKYLQNQINGGGARYYDESSHEAVKTVDKTKLSTTWTTRSLASGDSIFVAYISGDANNYQRGTTVTINTDDDFISMLTGNYNMFDSTDPLQCYIDYVVSEVNSDNQVVHVSQFMRGSNRWVMAWPQYCYYIKHIYGNNYGKNKSYQYTAEEYAGYLYANTNLSGPSPKISLDDYIDFLRDEVGEVFQSEGVWLLTGFPEIPKNTDGTPNTSATRIRISDIGGVTLWDITPWDATAVSKVVADEATYTYRYVDGDFTDPIDWNVQTKYLTAKDNKGLTADIYRQICTLGGSLYELTKDDTYTSAASYLFYLQQRRFAWTLTQTNFINEKFGAEGIDWAISATFYGDVLSYDLANARAVDVTAPGTVFVSDDGGETGTWFIDIDDDGVHDTNETVGSWNLNKATENTTVIIGDKEYELLRSVDLRAGNGLGAALYLDKNNDGLFKDDYTAQNPDELLIYEVDVNDSGFRDSNNPVAYGGADLKLIKINNNGTWENVDSTKSDGLYFNICRGVVANDNQRFSDGDSSELTGNKSDYLEEAVWWKEQGFTAKQFDQIKFHAMYKILVPETAVVRFTDGVATRGVGFTLADDWKAVNYTRVIGGTTDTGCNSGFGLEPDNFTPEDYVTIVLGTNYSSADIIYTPSVTSWESTFADYKMFSALNAQQVLSERELQGYYPTNNNYSHPFASTTDGSTFLSQLVSINLLADAMSIENDKQGYLELLRNYTRTEGRNGSPVADYIRWAENNIVGKDDKGNKQYFRLNHYIYYRSHNLGAGQISNFISALDIGARSKIFYDSKTEDKVTTNLMDFYKDWTYLDGKGQRQYHITLNNYCEWLNVYAYSDEYKMERGELIEGQEASPEGWLTLDAFAVWKRMEKYENNVEYLNKVDATNRARVTDIKTPILNRKISTTVLPFVAYSGNSPTTQFGTQGGKEPTLPSVMSSARADAYYGWNEYSGLSGYESMPKNRQRPWVDRFEYNEQYVVMDTEIDPYNYVGSVNSGNYSDNIEQLNFKVRSKNYLPNLLPITPGFAEDCTSSCTSSCTEPNHLYQIGLNWLNRYNFTMRREQPWLNGATAESTDSETEEVKKEYWFFGWHENKNKIDHINTYITLDWNLPDLTKQWYRDLQPTDDRPALIGEIFEETKENTYITNKVNGKSWNKTFNLSDVLDQYDRGLYQRDDGQWEYECKDGRWYAHIVLDEVNDKDHASGINIPIFVKDSNDGGYKTVFNGEMVSSSFAQLYVPYENFKSAAKEILDKYKTVNNCRGYHNYMKYWAHNGDWNWITLNVADKTKNAYNGPTTGMSVIDNNTYNYISFWDNFDPTRDDVFDNTIIDGVAYEIDNHDKDEGETMELEKKGWTWRDDLLGGKWVHNSYKIYWPTSA